MSKKMKKIEFKTFNIPFEFGVERTNPDDGKVLGLSAEALMKVIDEFTECFKISGLNVHSEGYLPRVVKVTGKFEILGASFESD